MEKLAKKEQEEKKDKRRGLFITFTVHTAILLLALFPIVTAMEQAEGTEVLVSMAHIQIEPQAQFVVNADKNVRKGSSNKPPKTKVETPKPEPTPPAPPKPEPAPVETVDKIEAPAVTSGNEPDAPVQVDEVPQQKPDPTPTPVNNAPSGKPSDTNSPGGHASTNTDASGDGGNDDFLQDGVFGRRVKYRPNIKGLTKQKGKIAIKVCVSREGTVIASKYLDKYSTLHDAQLIANAIRAARRYKFDRDYTAPEKQWGKLTFIFDI